MNYYELKAELSNAIFAVTEGAGDNMPHLQEALAVLITDGNPDISFKQAQKAAGALILGAINYQYRPNSNDLPF